MMQISCCKFASYMGIAVCLVDNRGQYLYPTYEMEFVCITHVLLNSDAYVLRVHVLKLY